LYAKYRDNGFTIDRDENAARNLEYLSTPLDSKHLTVSIKQGLSNRVYQTGSTGSSPGSYDGGDTSGGGTRQRTLAGPMRPTGPTSHVSLKQEADTKYSPVIFG